MRPRTHTVPVVQRIVYDRGMGASDPIRRERKVKAHLAARASILEAARRVATRDGARNLSLRGVAAEAGFAPAALYSYFTNKDEILLALAADDLSSLAKAMRAAASRNDATSGLSAAIGAALSQLEVMETMAAAAAALPAAFRCERATRRGKSGCAVRCFAARGGFDRPGRTRTFGQASGTRLHPRRIAKASRSTLFSDILNSLLDSNGFKAARAFA
jgi:AcrR family transcriptional regulator